jgi:hypothetical protein
MLIFFERKPKLYWGISPDTRLAIVAGTSYSQSRAVNVTQF